jgi:hypothetical protein
MRATAIGVLFAVLVAGYHGQQKQPKAAKVQQAGEEAPPKTVAPVARFASEKHGKSTYQETKGYLRKAFEPEYLAAWILVIAAVIGIAFTWRTLGMIQKQTDAMVKSDRAWVMVDLEKVPVVGVFGEIATRDRGGPERHFRSFNVRCVCSNQGQTAARIIEKRCAVVVINGDDELPKSPNLDVEIKDPVPHYLRANGEPWHGDWNIETEVADSDNVQLFVIYGVVRYTHLFSDDIAQTTFGYELSFNRELKRLIGHSRYNENT